MLTGKRHRHEPKPALRPAAAVENPTRGGACRAPRTSPSDAARPPCWRRALVRFIEWPRSSRKFLAVPPGQPKKRRAAACCTSSNTRVTRVSQTRALVPPRAPRCKPYSCASCQSLCGRVYASGGRSRPAGHAMMTCQVIIRSSARVDVVHRQALSCQVCAVWADECDSDAYAACAARNASVCAAR